MYKRSLLAPISVIPLLAHSQSRAERPGQGKGGNRPGHTQDNIYTSHNSAPGRVHLEDTSKKTGKRNRTQTKWKQRYLVTADCFPAPLGCQEWLGSWRVGRPSFRGSLFSGYSSESGQSFLPSGRRGLGQTGSVTPKNAHER